MQPAWLILKYVFHKVTLDFVPPLFLCGTEQTYLVLPCLVHFIEFKTLETLSLSTGQCERWCKIVDILYITDISLLVYMLSDMCLYVVFIF